ncbi:unnamed protein product [Rotaria socialis]
MVLFTIGIFYAHSIKVDNAVRRLNEPKQKRSIIFEYIMKNCSELLVLYPEFYQVPRFELCGGYGVPVTLAKLAILLSMLYDIYLLYSLYDLPVVIAIMGSISSYFFYANLTNNKWTIQCLELVLILAAYVMIFGQYLLSNVAHALKH